MWTDRQADVYGIPMGEIFQISVANVSEKEIRPKYSGFYGNRL